MNSYKLSDKDQDRQFLAGNQITGTAVFRKSEFKPDIIKVDERIVILLSTGKKYMGRVVQFNFEPREDIVDGHLRIVRA